MFFFCCFFFFFQAEDGIRDLVRSRGLGDVYKRQVPRRRYGARSKTPVRWPATPILAKPKPFRYGGGPATRFRACLLYTSDAADERSSVDLGGRRIIKKKKTYTKKKKKHIYNCNASAWESRNDLCSNRTIIEKTHEIREHTYNLN